MIDPVEIFPVHLHLNNSDVWLGWRSDEERDSFVMSQQGIVFAKDLSELVLKLGRTLPGCEIGEVTFFNVDSAISSLRSGSVADYSFVINIWNLLTDFVSTVDGSRTRMFRADFMDTYDVFFSRGGAAEIVGMKPEAISELDRSNALEVLEEGAALLWAKFDAQRVLV